VRDWGEGIAQEDADRLFERWHRGAGRSGTTGLGLAICRLAVQAHDGSIAAKRCEPGTEFRIDLPVEQAQQAAE
jgi:signal transduction histidine kinase